MNKGVSFVAAMLTPTIAPLAACANQNGSQSTTSPSSGAPGTERMTTQLKGADGTQFANATIDFANGYATVTVEAGPNQVLSPGFHGLQIHSVGKCESGDFSSAGSVYQAPDHTGYPASGDLTALQVRSDGSAKLVTTTNQWFEQAAGLRCHCRNGLDDDLVHHDDDQRHDDHHHDRRATAVHEHEHRHGHQPNQPPHRHVPADHVPDLQPSSRPLMGRQPWDQLRHNELQRLRSDSKMSR